MPRKEGLSLEERLQRAKELFERKQQEKQQRLQQLYASRLYRWARRSSILYLWIAQFILIDWALPYRAETDKISGGFFDSSTSPEKIVGGISYNRTTEIYIRTAHGHRFTTEFSDGSREPMVHDSIIIYKSLLLGDFKKIRVPRIDENFSIVNAVTFKYLPIILIFSGLAAVFIFIPNIEVKAFAWIVFICTVGGSILLMYGLFCAYQL
jgi:hypothetical protein